MEDDAKKEARRKKLADHRKWLEEIKAKQGAIAAKHSQQRTESMRKSLLRKTERAIQPQNDLAAMKSGENEKQSISSKHNEKEILRQRLFAKHFDLRKEYPKTTLEVHLGREMDKAVAEGNHREAERISRELYDLQVVHAVKEASTKATYEMKMMESESKTKPTLHWKFNRKERWERKGNN